MLLRAPRASASGADCSGGLGSATSSFVQHKPRLFALLLAVGGWIRPTNAEAHERWDVDATFGARFGGDTDLNAESGGGHVNLAPSFSWGGILAYRLQRDGFIYLSYSRQETNARFTQPGTVSPVATGGVSMEMFQFGGNIETYRGPLVPYLGFSLGANRLAALGRAARDEWSFGLVFEAGTKFEVTKWLHFRLLARLPITFLGKETNVLCLTASECVVGLDGEPLIQGEVHGGLGISF